jgi:hypothetical protein
MTEKKGAEQTSISEASDLRFRERHDNDIIELHIADDHDTFVSATVINDIEDLALEIDSMSAILPPAPKPAPEPVSEPAAAVTLPEIVSMPVAADVVPAPPDSAEPAAIMLSEDDFYVTGSDGFGDVRPGDVLDLFRAHSWEEMDGSDGGPESVPVELDEPEELSSAGDAEVISPVPVESADEFAVLDDNDDDVIHIGEELFADGAEEPLPQKAPAQPVTPAVAAEHDSGDDFIIRIDQSEDEPLSADQLPADDDHSLDIHIIEDNDAVVVDPAELIDGIRPLPEYKDLTGDEPDDHAEPSVRDTEPADELPDDLSLVHFEAPDTGEELPDDFELVPIDLDEARAIAEEDILFLTEDDLIEELDARDLIPLEEAPVPTAPRAEAVSPEPVRSVRWITPEQSYLSSEDRASIEADCSANRVLVIEEELEEPAAEPAVMDITDRIVIIEDASSIESFVATLDPAKQEDMRRLLAYLDGLFEKLPEDTVRNFAGSEYFDLYVRVMNELGV